MNNFPMYFRRSKKLYIEVSMLHVWPDREKGEQTVPKNHS